MPLQTTLRKVAQLAVARFGPGATVEELRDPEHRYVLRVDREIVASAGTLLLLRQRLEDPSAIKRDEPVEPTG